MQRQNASAVFAFSLTLHMCVTSLLIHGFPGRGFLLPQPGLPLRDLLVQFVIVSVRQLLILCLLGLLLGRWLGLLARFFLRTTGGLPLLTNVGFLCSFQGGWRVVRHHVLVVDPKLVGKPDRQRGRLRALKMNSFDIVPLLWYPALHERRHNGVHVVGDLLRGPPGIAKLHGGACGGRQVHECRTNGLLDFLCDLSGRGGVHCTLGLGLALPLAIHFSGFGVKHDGDGSLLRVLVKGLAEELGQTVDDAIVGEEDVVLGEELALGVELAELGLELAKVDDAGDALAQVGGEALVGYNVLVGALRVGDDEADLGRLVGVERVRERDLAGLQAGLVGDVALGAQGEPDGRLCDILLAF